MADYFLGVDVGTGSVRAALVSSVGHCIHFPNVSVQPVNIWNDKPDYYEQSSEDIWQACCSAVKVSEEATIVVHNMQCCVVHVYIQYIPHDVMCT